MPRITISLEPEERDALAEIARKEKRDPRSQAAMLLRQALEQRGLLKEGGKAEQAEGKRPQPPPIPKRPPPDPNLPKGD